MSTTQDVLRFWFGAWPYNEEIARAQSKIWFESSKELDKEIASKFSFSVDAALNNTLSIKTQDDVIANIILLDQFTRNIYRGSSQAFSGDSPALQLCLQLIDDNQHLDLPLHVAVFACMPLQHSEDLSIQERAITTFQTLVDKHGDKANGFLDFAMKHKKIIEEFGRYPHRNQALGRENTAKEQAYLDGNAMRFGQ